MKLYQFFAFVYSILSFVIGYSCTRARQIEPPTAHKTEDLAIRTPEKTMSKLMCSGTVSSSCSNSRTHRNTFVANPIISRKWGKERIVKVYLTKREHGIVSWLTHLTRLTVSSFVQCALWSRINSVYLLIFVCCPIMCHYVLSSCRRVHVVFTFYLCLLAHSGVQRILCCVFALIFFVLCCQFLWIVHFWMPLSLFSYVYLLMLGFVSYIYIYIYIFTLPYQKSLFVIRCFRIRL